MQIKEVRKIEYRKYYLREFVLYDGDHDVKFNIVDIDTGKKEITVLT
jgi:hypothetical protein